MDRSKLLNTAGLVLLAVLVVPFVVFAVPQVVGAEHSFVVVSSSMAPAFHAGSAVVVNDVDPTSVDEGDVITFEAPGENFGGEGDVDRVTHRVVDVVEEEDGLYFQTKGDANEEVDQQLVPAENLIGRVFFAIPLIGWVLDFGGSQTGLLALVVVPSALLVVGEVWDLYQAATTGEEDKNQPSVTVEDD
ncbi:signal peptidase, endoplasmic reticulum-type [Halogranum gelatinilyticum]|uniref:Signal peptidase I n=1 Tax=Halogranum gelatinilyticum TaxID=660521 RepID=A0A1G9VW96_9EURY|nr:signal peptidase I [Halogranum gelatinilyticum]SDM76554.1 signal peptidase, endoplasmic reticulum-type [Halogranum gelatinilyticum]